MRGFAVWIMLGAIGLLSQGGCDNAPPPNRVPVPTSANPDQMRPMDYVKPLPPEDNRVDLRVPNQPIPEPPPPSPPPNASNPPPTQHSFADVQRDFLDAYKQVGQPRMVIFVNHTLQGQLVPATAPEPWLASEPAAEHPAPAKYLRPEQYDQASASAVDYAGIENRLADWLSNKGQVTMTPPAAVRQKLSDNQIKQLQAGHADAVAGLDADIFIQVQTHPVQQTQRGLQLQLEVRAINVKGGQAIGHATVDMEAPIDQGQIDGTTRTISRELMVDMIRTWTAPLPVPNPQP